MTTSPMVMPELVECSRRKMRLTEPSCVRFWQSANPVAPPPWEGRASCHVCPQGAARAGVNLDPMADARRRLAPVCPRCANVSDRLINNRVCVSCYNRERELLIGRNAKGTVPRLAPPLGVITRVVACGTLITQQSVLNVTSAIEAAIIIAKTATEPFMIGLAPLSRSFLHYPSAMLPPVQFAFRFAA